jgi:hypothetical protein
MQLVEQSLNICQARFEAMVADSIAEGLENALL